MFRSGAILNYVRSLAPDGVNLPYMFSAVGGRRGGDGRREKRGETVRQKGRGEEGERRELKRTSGEGKKIGGSRN